MPCYKIDVTNTQRVEFIVKAGSAKEAAEIFEAYTDENAEHLDVLDQSPDQKVVIGKPKSLGSSKPPKTFFAWEDLEDENRRVDVVDAYEK